MKGKLLSCVSLETVYIRSFIEYNKGIKSLCLSYQKGRL